jgi:hypothetical protein
MLYTSSAVGTRVCYRQFVTWTVTSSQDLIFNLLPVFRHQWEIQKEDEVCRACSTNGEKRNAYRMLVGKPEGKRPLGRPRHRWVDNIKMDLREIGWDGMDWIDLA